MHRYMYYTFCHAIGLTNYTCRSPPNFRRPQPSVPNARRPRRSPPNARRLRRTGAGRVCPRGTRIGRVGPHRTRRSVRNARRLRRTGAGCVEPAPVASVPAERSPSASVPAERAPTASVCARRAHRIFQWEGHDLRTGPPHAEGPPSKKKIRYGLRGYISVGWKLQLFVNAW